MRLLANLWIPLVAEADPGGFWPGITWDRMLEGGGRLVLGMVIAAIAIELARKSAVPRRDNGSPVSWLRRTGL